MNDSANLWQSKKVIAVTVVLLVILSALSAVKTIGGLMNLTYIGREAGIQDTIVVSGDGEAFAKPDIATFSFTIEESAKVVSDAQTAVEAKTKKAIEAMVKGGVAEKDIKTSSYSIYPKYEYQQVICTQWSCPPQSSPKIEGYTVSESFEIKVRDISKAGDLLSVAGAIGVMNLSGLTFDIDKKDSIQSQARSEAINKAEAKAKELAKELGVSLGRVVSFSESGSYPPIYYAKNSAYGMGGDAESSPGVSVSAGETRIVSNVTITYEIH